MKIYQYNLYLFSFSFSSLRIIGAFKSITTETFFLSASSDFPSGPAKPVVNHPHNSKAMNESPIITMFFVSGDLTLSNQERFLFFDFCLFEKVNIFHLLTRLFASSIDRR